MREFFKGWRRKARLVALAMAVLLAGAWMRSYENRDQVVSQFNQTTHILESFDGCLSWKLFSPARNSIPLMYQMNFAAQPEVGSPFEWRSVPASSCSAGDIDIWTTFGCKTKWRWQCGGFIAGSVEYDFPSTRPLQRISVYFVPYWSLVLPLTLLSAWLILAKPRKAKAATGSTP